MPPIVEVKYSNPEGSLCRQTTTNSDGTSTDKTLEKGKSWTVTDHKPDGSSKSYEGAPGAFSGFSGVTRLKELD